MEVMAGPTAVEPIVTPAMVAVAAVMAAARTALRAADTPAEVVAATPVAAAEVIAKRSFVDVGEVKVRGRKGALNCAPFLFRYIAP